MQKNVSGQFLTVYVWDSTTGLPKTGDAANLTAYRAIDGGSVTVLGDTSATEKDSTNAKGYYQFDLTQAETNGDVILFSCKSSTANMVCKCTPDVVQTVPSSFVIAPGSAGAIFVGGTNAATTVTTSFTTTFTGNLTGSVGSLATQAKADVNAEVVDCLNVDTYAEPGQGAPAATASIVAKLGYAYKSWRNKKTQTATVYSLFADDATTVDQKATVSDDGSTTTIGEVASGP